MLNMYGTKVVFERDWHIRMQSRSMLLSMILLPVTYLLFLAVGLNNVLQKMSFDGISLSYLLYIFPGILGIAAMSTGRLCGNIFHIEKRSGMLEVIYASPITRQSLLFGRFLSAFVLCLIQGAGILLLVFLLQGSQLHVTVNFLLMMLLALFFGTLAFSSLSIMLAALFRSEETHNALASIIFTPLNFISTAFYPATALPKILWPIVQLNPLTHMVDVLRYIMVSEFAKAYTSLGYLIIVSIIILGFASYVFSKTDAV